MGRAFAELNSKTLDRTIYTFTPSDDVVVEYSTFEFNNNTNTPYIVFSAKNITATANRHQSIGYIETSFPSRIFPIMVVTGVGGNPVGSGVIYILSGGIVIIVPNVDVESSHRVVCYI